MKTQPIVPARITGDGEGPGITRTGGEGRPSPHGNLGALSRAQHVFLAGNGLPQRWRGRTDFVVLDTGFGAGHHFLATWDAWRRDPQRCARLHYVALDAHPPRREDLPHAHRRLGLPVLAAQLQAAWPATTAGVHALSLDEGGVHLLLGWGEINTLLPEIHGMADAFFLDGALDGSVDSSSDDSISDAEAHRDPVLQRRPLLKLLGRRAAPGATAVCPFDTQRLRAGLQAAGFAVEHVPEHGGMPAFTRARFAPRWPVASIGPPACAPESVIVVGAGLAGASAAAALAARGWAVTVLERHDRPAAEASGNPGGLFHGTLHADDGPHARLLRAAALQAARCYRPLIEAGLVRGDGRGLLRLAGRDTRLAAMRATLAALGLPASYVQALDTAAATALAGVPLATPAWFYPGGGWLAPADLVRHWLGRPGVALQTGAAVARIEATAQDGRPVDLGAPGSTAGWQAVDAAGQVIARAPVLVLAGAAATPGLLATLGAADPLRRAPWTLGLNRGQIDGWRGSATPLALPVAGDGYALPLADGLLYGASISPAAEGEPARPPNETDTAFNRERLLRLAGLVDPCASPTAHAAAQAAAPDAGSARAALDDASARLEPLRRSALRMQTPDRLPLAGPLPWPRGTALRRADPLRRLPRWPGLYVLTALGSRGITWAPLLGALLAAQIAGHPWPLERDLADALDPARRPRRGPKATTADD